MAKAETKTCTGCKSELPLSEFHQDKRHRDGKQSRCKVCRSSKGVEPPIRKPPVETAIDSFSQIESVIRSMAETQAAIDAEQALCDKRVKLVQEYSQEAIDPLETNLEAWRSRLEKYLLGDRKGVSFERKHQFRFGSIHIAGQKMEIELEPNLAVASADKP